jgi:DNA-binding XRE family transcriptional regulator
MLGMGEAKDPAAGLVAELKREITFLTERQRLELGQWLNEDFAAVDLGEIKTERLHQRMGDAVEVLGRVAGHLGLEDDAARLAMTMRAFDQAPDAVRGDWNARKVSRALRGSWELAKGIAFQARQLPVGNARRWERQQELRFRQRGARFAVSSIHDWLATAPPNKSVRAYLCWRQRRNQELKPGQKPYPSYPTISQSWRGSWAELIEAAERGRLPPAAKEDLGDADADHEARIQAAVEELQGVELADPADFDLATDLRARRLAEARQAREWNRGDLERASGVGWKSIRRIEVGEIDNPYYTVMLKLARALEVSLDYFATPDGGSGFPKLRAKA